MYIFWVPSKVDKIYSLHVFVETRNTKKNYFANNTLYVTRRSLKRANLISGPKFKKKKTIPHPRFFSVRKTIINFQRENQTGDGEIMQFTCLTLVSAVPFYFHIFSIIFRDFFLSFFSVHPATGVFNFVPNQNTTRRRFFTMARSNSDDSGVNFLQRPFFLCTLPLFCTYAFTIFVLALGIIILDFFRCE